MDYEEKTLHKESIYNGKIIDVRVHEVQLPDGRTGKREVVNHPGAVAVIARTPSGKIILVRQYRKALEKELFEIPAGKLEPGEDPEMSAFRELEEETGYRAHGLKKTASFYTSPGFADEIIHLYEADRVTKGQTSTDEDEFVELVEVSLEEAQQFIREEKIHDAKTMYAVQHLMLSR
ncbi:NUDIX hydrolase [Salibacterium qingdaonense]|uniref:ADP-ribose pyrophosphatase n=1 Tax=Salibacterium qingdaonense TaxID=266892 RepID=A0A1I4JRU9_9BACI|nr:NUDIX hydrolase [Salibacterium qingdaonense]SFL69289.1 ADP-ribose pyrophosphatase [Salibacterium qingdaonense]